MYSVSDDNPFEQGKCGNDEHSTPEKSVKSTIYRVRRALVSNIDEVYRPYLTTDETRYNEVVFVVDNTVYQRYHNNTKTVTDRVIIMCNAVDAIYQRINIRLVMKHIDIWTNGDRMERQTSGGAELGKFKEYRTKYITPTIPHDNAQFLSHKGWTGGVIGMAWVRSMCTGNSAGVNRWSMSGIVGPVVVVAHEMGHNFGFGHDSGTCKCLTRRGCIMGGHKTRVAGFSNCSMAGLQRINDKCLYNVPTKAMNAQCGNGIREGNEECDCGTPEMCAAQDPCCEPHGCRLKRHAVCSDLHHSCCNNCQFKLQGTLCRAVTNDCDIPEYCPGDSRDCPADSYIQNGIACNQSEKLIQANTNRNSVVARPLSPKVQARYVRISPQYWTDWPCMKVELLGCSGNEGASAAAPSPMKAYNDHCVVPQDASCSPAQGSSLVFRPGYECKGDYMEFAMDTTGILRHTCSGRKLCPEGGSKKNGARIVISDSCSDEDAKFERTSGKSLKHVKSQKCVHPKRGWPGNGRELILYSGCDEERLELWFMKQDCILPLGMRSGAIRDSQITASSFHSSYKPHYGRLHNRNYWCAAARRKTDYIQIDLGEEKTVSRIQTQGRGNRNGWVTAYHLSYSQDGQRWTPYSERGLHSNSLCYNGKCADTLDTQCRDLWGEAATNAAKSCYDKLNTEASGYGTCDETKNTTCSASNVQCGQIQCLSPRSTPLISYGKSYKLFTLADGTKCSGAALKTSDMVGRGMVAPGTKCGDGKMCVNAECKTLAEHGITKCPMVNGKECAGRGICTSDLVCHCDSGYDSSTNCQTAMVTRDGGFGEWSAWTECSRGCEGGKRQRHRFCDNPYPSHGGKDCVGERFQEKDCQTQACPDAKSCRHLQEIAANTGLNLGDGVYTLHPQGQSGPAVKAYCDMTRDGGGWTLLVSSHTNTWTAGNLRLRNEGSPSLTSDYSILKYADDIKNDANIVGNTFEYRLEAQNRGRWGGVWSADRSYSFTATNNKQTNVHLVKKFDDWTYSYKGIDKRMPWVSGARLTTSESATRNWWGTITGDYFKYHPAPWISGDLKEAQPSYIWYWMREGSRQTK